MGLLLAAYGGGCAGKKEPSGWKLFRFTQRSLLSVVLEGLHLMNDSIYHSDAFHSSQDSPTPELTAVS